MFNISKNKKYFNYIFVYFQTCICARICQSLVLGKKSSLRDLSNHYILSTQKHGWRALEDLMNIQEDEFIKLLKN